MCITTAEAKLTNTKIMSFPLDNGRHMMSYTNKATNLSGKPNAMILPIPGTLNQDWFYVTTEYNEFMDEIKKQAQTQLKLSAGSKGISRSLSFEEFNVGFYKVITTNDIDRLKYRLLDLDERQRPEISSELLDFFKSHYEGWSFVVCIFADYKEMDAQPIMFEYEPFDYNWVYFPTMDSHDGGAPSFIHPVELDHTLITTQEGLNEKYSKKVSFSQEIPEVLKRRKYIAHDMKMNLPNGDIYINIEELIKESDFHGSSINSLKRELSHPGLAIA